MAEDIVRVIRIYEFTGPRSAVELQLQRSIQSERDSTVSGPELDKEGQGTGRNKLYGIVRIRAATLGTFPEVLGQTKEDENETSL